jgi:lipopolysaccharide heptosyltransferase II
MVEYRRILIIKPSSLGDIVHALPTLAALRRRFPLAHIAWLVKRQWAGFLDRAEGLDEVCSVEPTVRGWLAQVPRLRAASFDLVVDLQGLFRSGAITWLTGCPTRIGFANGREGSSCFYTQRVAVPSSNLHAVDRYLLIAAALGAPVDGEPAFRFHPLDRDRQEVTQLLSRQGVPASQAKAGWIAVNVAARWPTKRWPPESFAVAADQLQREGLGPIVLIGGPDERPVTQAVKALMKSKPVDLTGETAPGLLPALLESAALLLTNDSGPMHVAAAVGTPVVALFGPTSPIQTGPYGKQHVVLTSGVPCSPCFSRRCRNRVRLECLTAITPEQVLEAIRAQLALRLAR